MHTKKFFSKLASYFCFTKRRIITACIVGGLMLGLILVRIPAFFKDDCPYPALYFILSVLVVLLYPLILSFKAPKSEKAQNYLCIAAVLLMPTVTLTMTEALNQIFVYNMYYSTFIAGYILDLMLCAVVYVCCGSFKVSLIAANAFNYLLALANYYVKLFRGTPFLPIDFLSVSTAKDVAGTYDYSPTYSIVIATVLFVGIILISCRIKTPEFNLKTKIISRACCIVTVVVIFVFYWVSNFFANTLDLKPDFWNQSRGYKTNGVVLSFFLNIKYLYVNAPAGYDADKVEDIVYKLSEEYDSGSIPSESSEEKPDIICIMNESFADLSVINSFETNEDYMPFYRSLTENTVKGNLIMPVKGAGTSNSEFEFLTGCTMSFYPSGSNAYTLYVKNELPSLVSILKQNGYKNLAFHPYYPKGWNRVNVYNNLGFSRYDSIYSIIDNDILRDFGMNIATKEDYINAINNAYGANNHVLLRQYVSDEYDYDNVINYYEQRDKSSPFFLFNVTMQNHGSYTGTSSNFTEDIYVTDTNDEKEYNKTNQYLSLMKASDTAYKGLIEYFSNVKKPVIICMFGDHQPSIEEDFYSKLLGKSVYEANPQEDMKLYTTPFCIWANYDIEEQQIEKLSSNYLSSLMLKTSGAKLSPYNKYLLKLSETLPVISTFGYCDNNGGYYSWNAKSDYTSLLNDYKKVQYNYLFDKKHRVNKLYSAN